MPENREWDRLLRLLWGAVWCLGLWAATAVALPWLLPFLLALALSGLLEPAVAVLTRMGLPRWAAAALCTAAIFLLAGGLLALGLWRAWSEAAGLLRRLPALLAGLEGWLGRVEGWIYRLQVAVPPVLRQVLFDALDALSQRTLELSTWAAGQAGRALAGAAAALPETVLFLLTTVLATYFTSAGRPNVLAFLSRQLPEWGLAVLAQLKGALAGWLRTQGLLMLITFGELLPGLMLLGAPAPLLLAALTALVDALPVLGAGTVLLPWAAGCLLGGQAGTALGLLALYAAVCLVRSLLEPRLLGERMGLHPLAALCAMYIGFQAAGLAGMLLGPLILVLLDQLRACGLIRLWRD